MFVPSPRPPTTSDSGNHRAFLAHSGRHCERPHDVLVLPFERRGNSPLDPRFRAEIARAPNVSRKQGLAPGAHGVGCPGGMVDPCPRRTKPPVGLAGTPPGAPRPSMRTPQAIAPLMKAPRSPIHSLQP